MAGSTAATIKRRVRTSRAQAGVARAGLRIGCYSSTIDKANTYISPPPAPTSSICGCSSSSRSSIASEAMATASSLLLSSLLLLLALSGSWMQTASGKQHKLKPSPKHEKFQEHNFFLHDDLLVSNASAFFVVPPLAGIPKEFPSEGKALFGGVVVIDDPLTEGPDPASNQIGQAKGFYVWDGLVGGPALEFVFTAVFNDASGFAPGTTLSYRGHDYLPADVREIAIVGGTGDLRLARGWAQFSVTKAVQFTAVLNFTSSVFYGGYRS